MCIYPEAEVRYLDHKFVGTGDHSSHRDHAIVATFEGVHDRVGSRLSDRELNVVAIRTAPVGVVTHPPANLSDATWMTAGF